MQPISTLAPEVQEYIAGLEDQIEAMESDRANTKVRVVTPRAMVSIDLRMENFQLQQEVARLKERGAFLEGQVSGFQAAPPDQVRLLHSR